MKITDLINHIYKLFLLIIGILIVTNLFKINSNLELLSRSIPDNYEIGSSIRSLDKTLEEVVKGRPSYLHFTP